MGGWGGGGDQNGEFVVVGYSSRLGVAGDCGDERGQLGVAWIGEGLKSRGDGGEGIGWVEDWRRTRCWDDCRYLSSLLVSVSQSLPDIAATLAVGSPPGDS